MTDWIDFLIYAAFLFALWFVQPVAQQRLAIPFLEDRNPDWAAAHPEAVRAIGHSRWRVWLGWTLGVLSIGALAAFQLGLWRLPPPPPGTPVMSGWMALWIIAMGSMLVAIVVGGTIGLYRHFQIRRHIPIGPRRIASLERRSLDDYVPRSFQYVAYALLAANAAAWMIAAILGTHSSPIFWSRVVTIFFLTGFFLFFSGLTVKRRANVMDRIFGPSYRRWEVRWGFSTLFTVPIVGALRLYEEVNGVFLFDMSRAVQLSLALYITYSILRVSVLPVDPDTRQPQPRGVPAPQN